MSKGLYATVTRFPFSDEAANAMMSIGSFIIDDLYKKKRLGEVLDEAYGKVTEDDKLDYPDHLSGTYPDLNISPISLGSSWWLECYETHGFHYHTYAEQDLELSFRRVLFIANKGFTIELYPINFETQSPIGPLEKYRLNGASFAELQFDGKIVHRFRPLKGGRLYAYSMHTRDLSDDLDVAATQTHPVNSGLPDEIISHII